MTSEIIDISAILFDNGILLSYIIDKLLKMIVGLSKKKGDLNNNQIHLSISKLLSIVFIKQSNRLKQIQIQR